MSLQEMNFCKKILDSSQEMIVIGQFLKNKFAAHFNIPRTRPVITLRYIKASMP